MHVDGFCKKEVSLDSLIICKLYKRLQGLRGSSVEKFRFLSCFNTFPDVTGTIALQSSFLPLRDDGLVWVRVFLSAMNTDICVSGKKECDCLSNAVQEKEAKLFPMPSITSFETAHYLKIF